MSCPATVAVPSVGGKSVVSMWIIVDLPAAVRPEEAVDLARVQPGGRSPVPL